MASEQYQDTINTLRQEVASLRRQLSRSHRYSQLILDSALDYAIIVADVTGKVTEWSEGAHQILGWTREEMLGQSMHRFFTVEDRELGVPEREIGQAISLGHADDDRWHLRADGKHFWASGVMMPIWDDGQFAGVIKIIRDLTKRVEAEQRQQLHTEQLIEQFKQLADTIPQLVWISDPEDNDLYFNPRWEAFAGRSAEQLATAGWQDLIEPSTRAKIIADRSQALATRSDWEATFQMRHQGGALHWCLCRALPIHNAEGKIVRWFSTCTDVDALQSQSSTHEQDLTALRALKASQDLALTHSNQELNAERHERGLAEDKVRQLQKMEAVGQLTGGVAHDFNNMLTVIMGGLNLLMAKLKRGDQNVQRYAELAMDGTVRAAELTHRLLAFSRQQPLVPEVVDLNRLVSGLSALLQRTLGGNYRVEIVRHAGLWFAQADVNSLEQAIVNLCVNARDSMENGGAITVETGNVYLDDNYARQEGVQAGEYVLVAVTDTGTGIDPQTLKRVFEPYFTTKPVGRGTGLGLSQVYGFVGQSQGHLKIYSEVGHGTAVKIYLPRYLGEDMPVDRLDVPFDENPRARNGELIIVVEDDPRVRLLAVESLLELGYSVLDADGGEAALGLLDRHPEAALVLTDVVMPGMTGRELAERIALTQPDIKILYATAYTRNSIVHNGTLDRGVSLLPKPFTLRDLAIKVRQVLDS